MRKDLWKKWDFSTLLCGQFDLSEIDDAFRRSEISLQNEVQDFYFVYANVVYLQQIELVESKINVLVKENSQSIQR